MTIRRILVIAGGLLAAFVLVSTMALAIGGLTWRLDSGETAAQTEQDSDRRTVSVSGQGEVSVRPDTGLANVGVEVRNEDLDTAVSEASEQVDSITAAVMDLGVAEEDIQTANFSIRPEYRHDEGETRELTGYVVQHDLNVKVRELEQTGDVVSAAVDAGANVVNNVAFIVDDPGDAVSQARERAVEEARTKAEELAELTDSSLGPVVNISESSQTPRPGPVPVEEAEDGARADVGFQPGQSVVSVSVNVTWELQ